MRLPRMTKRRLMIAVAVAFLVWVRNQFWPPDWVEVTVHRVPAGVRYLHLIADGSAGPRTLLWYHFEARPAHLSSGQSRG